MGKNTVDSNISGVAIAEELSLGVLPVAALWQRYEPNSFPGDFGQTVSMVARDTINPTRQVQKGTVTGIAVKGGMTVDLTQDNLTDVAQGFFFASYTRNFSAAKDAGGVAIPDGNVFNTVAAFNAALIQPGSLIFGKNYKNGLNNGMKLVTAVSAPNKTITVAGSAAEPAPPSNAGLFVVGYEAGALSIAVVGGIVILTSQTDDFTTLGLQVGQFVFIGGDVALNQFATNKPGYARVQTVTQTQLTFDLVTFAAVAEASTAGKKIRLFFGRYLQNASNVAALYRRSYTIERTLGTDPTGAPQAEYLIGAIPNQFVMTADQKSKVTVDIDFVAMDYKTRSSSSAPTVLMSASGAYVAAPANQTAFNTSQDLYLIRIAPVDSTTLTPTLGFGYATNAKMTINNGVTPNDALTVLGAIDASAADFAVTGSVTAYFNDVQTINAIRNNADVAMQLIMAKRNAGQVWDTPLLSLGGGSPKVEKGKPIMLDLTTSAAQNPNGYTLSASFFDYLPTSAMPTV